MNFTKFHLLIFLLFPAFIAAQDAVNQVDGKGLKQGKWVKTENGIKKYEGSFKDDKPVGTFTHYYPNNVVKAIIVHGTEGQARASLFHFNGKLKAEGKFINEKKDSVWTFYDEEKKLISRETYVNNKKQGLSVSYHKNGKESEQCTYENNLKQGICKEFFDNGSLRKELSYSEDIPDGKFRLYYLNTVPYVAGTFSKGTKTGEWIEYNENGTVKVKQEFGPDGSLKKETRLNGSFQDTWPDNIPKSFTTYLNGKKNGEFKEFYDVGTWVKEVRPGQDGYPDEIVEKLEGQAVKVTGTYKDDKLDGKVTYYKENGKVEKIENYSNGQLIKK